MFGWAHLLPDEHAGDDEAVHAQEDVQDVTQPRVVQHHGPWGGGVRGQRSLGLPGSTSVEPLHTFRSKHQPPNNKKTVLENTAKSFESKKIMVT